MDEQELFGEEDFDEVVARSRAMVAFADAMDHGYILQGLRNRGFTTQQSLDRLDECRVALRAVLQPHVPDAAQTEDEDHEEATLSCAAIRRRLSLINRKCVGIAGPTTIATVAAPFTTDPSGGCGEGTGGTIWDCFDAKLTSFETAASFVSRAQATDQLFWLPKPAKK